MNDASRGPVVVGVDGSEADLETLLWAAAEANRRHAEVLIVHAQDVVERSAVSASPVVTLASEGLDFTADLVAQSVHVVGQAFPELPIRTLIRHDTPAHVLLEQCQDAALIVLGTHGDNRFVGALLGSVSQKLAAHGTCPVVVIPANASHLADRSNSVVVGVSRSAGGRAALQFAFGAAQLRDAELVAVRCWHEPPVYAVGAAGIGYVVPPPLAVLRDAEKTILEDCLAEVQLQFPDVKVRAELAERPTDRVLIECSRDAALLVVGCRHEDGNRLSRLGPISSWLLHNSEAPIVVVGFKESVGTD